MNENSSLSFKNIFRRETKLASYIVICLTIVVLSLSYAMFFQVDSNSKNQVVTAGDLKFTYSNGSQITSNANSKCFEPMSSDEALLYFNDCSYQFSVQNTGSLKASYTLKLIANAANTIETSKLKVILKKKVGETLEVVSGFPKTLSELAEGVLLTDEMNPKDVLVFSAQIFVDEATSIESDTSKTVSFQIEGTGVVHEDQPINTDPTSVDKITELAKTGTTNLAYDGTVDNNLRYIGENPNNYVTFNNELWRIIGVMNNVSDDAGNTSPKLKIIRNEIYKEMDWDIDGIYDWSRAMSQIELNSTYYENLTDKDKIANIKWNLGGIAEVDYSSANNGLASHFYGYERKEAVDIGSPSLWTGKIGLMYPSDYGYATSGGGTQNREACLAKELAGWDDVSYSDCKTNDWLYDSFNAKWTLTLYSMRAIHGVFIIDAEGYLSTSSAPSANAVAPTLYLKPEVTIVGGSGTESAPYQLG